MTCTAKTEVFSRIVGYYRPVQQWNPGKQAEYDNRVEYNEGKARLKELLSVGVGGEPQGLCPTCNGLLLGIGHGPGNTDRRCIKCEPELEPTT